eukprot:CAMPEP_0181033294 /NCGR_PEP_ID=MMETSP1070-20121207/7181_1 /TAXON_ID=265543 /ORGANISM="Minutocellus polymorphus, Strain NH13" /LENGTH=381 /DNA_ID=CAMNT_0023110713 /DNA_START=171 /DNA_END=1316 /DNA_ORIENTATION=-
MFGQLIRRQAQPLAKRTLATMLGQATGSSTCTSSVAVAALATTAAALVTVSAVARCEQPTDEAVELLDVNEPARFGRCLAYHRALRTQYASRWDWANEGSRLPTTSWPTSIPEEEDVAGLTADLRYCRRSPNYRNDEDYCDALRFRIGSYWLLHGPDVEGQKKGLRIIRDLAERGHPDGMVLYGMCLNEGRAGLDPNPQQAVVWFRLCSDMHFHPQAGYELGVALYTGEGAAEDEAAAARMFRRAADTGHPAAAYMLGDCLLDGVGVVRDRAEALEWLVTAAELGHRGARSRVLAVLERDDAKDYGQFTDASRQTLKDSVPTVVASASETKTPEERDQSEGRFQQREATFERRFTIGGGARNPVVLARRRTIINESRDAEK